MKIKKFDGIYISIAVLIVIAGLFLPKSGHLALLDVAFDTILFWAVTIYIVIKVRKIRGRIKENWYIYLLCLLFMVFSLWMTKNVVVDVIKGPQVIELQNIHVSKLQGTKGLSSLHYYMNGEDAEGKAYKIEISGQQYSSMSTRKTAVITYYENTKRFYGFGDER